MWRLLDWEKAISRPSPIVHLREITFTLGWEELQS